MELKVAIFLNLKQSWKKIIFLLSKIISTKTYPFFKKMLFLRKKKEMLKIFSNEWPVSNVKLHHIFNLTENFLLNP